jgi:hypothetical protein
VNIDGTVAVAIADAIADAIAVAIAVPIASVAYGTVLVVLLGPSPFPFLGRWSLKRVPEALSETHFCLRGSLSLPTGYYFSSMSNELCREAEDVSSC